MLWDYALRAAALRFIVLYTLGDGREWVPQLLRQEVGLGESSEMLKIDNILLGNYFLKSPAKPSVLGFHGCNRIRKLISRLYVQIGQIPQRHAPAQSRSMPEFRGMYLTPSVAHDAAGLRTCHHDWKWRLVGYHRFYRLRTCRGAILGYTGCGSALFRRIDV